MLCWALAVAAFVPHGAGVRERNGIIAGVVTGGCALVAFVLLAAFLLVQRRRKNLRLRAQQQGYLVDSGKVRPVLWPELGIIRPLLFSMSLVLSLHAFPSHVQAFFLLPAENYGLLCISPCVKTFCEAVCKATDRTTICATTSCCRARCRHAGMHNMSVV